jgi:hypothetical protein
MPYRIWPDMMPWVDETIASALAVARRDQAEADAKIAAKHVVIASDDCELHANIVASAIADEIRLRARGTEAPHD